MDEETTGTTQAKENIGNGDQSPPISLIEQADSLNKGLDTKIKQLTELLNRNEQVLSRIILSGQARAGSVQATPEQIEQDKVKQSIDDRMKRLGFNKR